MRNAPPISTSSPRETMTSRPAASAARPSSTAAALLLTAKPASPPVVISSSPSTCVWREPRSPVSGSISRSVYPDSTARTASCAAWLSGARPRLVWMMIPVALMARVSRECPDQATARVLSSITRAGDHSAGAVSSISRRRAPSTTCRTARAASGRGIPFKWPPASSCCRTRSTDGSCRSRGSWEAVTWTLLLLRELECGRRGLRPAPICPGAQAIHHLGRHVLAPQRHPGGQIPAVEVCAAGDQQVEAPRDFQVALHHGRRVVRIIRFDPLQPRSQEAVHHPIVAQPPRVRQHRDAPGAADDLHGLHRGDLQPLHIRRAVTADVLGERLRGLGDVSGLHEGPGYVRPPHGAAAGKRQDPLHLDGDAQRRQLLYHAFGAVQPAVAKPAQQPLQPLQAVVDEVA